MLVPPAQAAGWQERTSPPWITMLVPDSACWVRVVKDTLDTAAMDAKASPRNPKVWIWPRSAALAILLVAWRKKATGTWSASIPAPLSVTRK